MTKGIDNDTLYKVVNIEGVSFEIRYGYESSKEIDKGWEPTPIYPDFLKNPRYTPKGYPFITVYQAICDHYEPKEDVSGEDWCNDCLWMEQHETYIGICRCKDRKRK